MKISKIVNERLIVKGERNEMWNNFWNMIIWFDYMYIYVSFFKFISIGKMLSLIFKIWKRKFGIFYINM